MQNIQDHKELGKHHITKETDKVPITGPKEIEIYELSDK